EVGSCQPAWKIVSRPDCLCSLRRTTSTMTVATPMATYHGVRPAEVEGLLISPPRFSSCRKNDWIPCFKDERSNGSAPITRSAFCGTAATGPAITSWGTPSVLAADSPGGTKAAAVSVRGACPDSAGVVWVDGGTAATTCIVPAEV